MKKNRMILLFLVVTGLLLALPISKLFPIFDVPPNQEHLRTLDKIAEEMLEATKKGDIEKAKHHIDQLADLFPNQTLPISIRIESLNAVTQSILSAKQVFATSKEEENIYLWHATRVRIAIDALSHDHQPMWKQYYSSFSNQMQQLLQVSVTRDAAALRSQLEENYQLYLVIRPAMSIHLQEQQMSKIAAHYEHLLKETKNESLDWQIIRETLRDLHGDIQESFAGEDKSTIGTLMAPGSPFMLIITIALAVTVTLSYVAWKKYVAEQGNAA